jgi:hypothetical protein
MIGLAIRGGTAMTFDELVEVLRGIKGLRDTGKVHPHFQFRSRPFLHFHGQGEDTYADVKWDGTFEPVPAATPEERRALLNQVREHVAANPPRSRSPREVRGRSG